MQKQVTQTGVDGCCLNHLGDGGCDFLSAASLSLKLQLLLMHHGFRPSASVVLIEDAHFALRKWHADAIRTQGVEYH